MLFSFCLFFAKSQASVAYLKKRVILQHTIISSVQNFSIQLQSTSYNSSFEGFERFCYVEGGGNNVLTLRSVRKRLGRVKILPKMALHIA